MDYSDIIDHPRHISKTRKPMPMSKRAAQFSPFKALTGYEDKVEETARYTENWIPPDEDRIEEIERVLRDIRYLLESGRQADIFAVHFVPDMKKEGGEYREIAASVEKIDKFKKELVLANGGRIPLELLLELELIGTDRGIPED